MCYAKPGPRCSGHARLALQEKTREYVRVLDDADSTDADVQAATDARQRAQNDYDLTPEGIREIRARGFGELADLNERTRAQMVQRYRGSQAATADQEMYNSVEDIAPMTMVVDDGKVKVVEDVHVGHESVPSYNLDFTDGTSRRYAGGNYPVLLATPDGEVPLKTRNIDHQNAYAAALANLPNGTPPKGDKVIVYARNSRGQDVTAVLKGGNVRSKHGWEHALTLAQKMDSTLGDDVSISVMTTDPDITPQKIRSTQRFMANMANVRRKENSDVELFIDRKAV